MPSLSRAAPSSFALLLVVPIVLTPAAGASLHVSEDVKEMCLWSCAASLLHDGFDRSDTAKMVLGNGSYVEDCPELYPHPFKHWSDWPNACCSSPLNCDLQPLEPSADFECCSSTSTSRIAVHLPVEDSIAEEATCENHRLEYDVYLKKLTERTQLEGTPLVRSAGAARKLLVGGAKQYVTGNVHIKDHEFRAIGQAQFMLVLKYLRLKPADTFLEIGCGALTASRHFIRHLLPNRYYCVEPNSFLRKQVLREGDFASTVRKRNATFIKRSDFDPRPRTGDLLFDYTYSHSVLSHAADWQLYEYFAVMRAVLRPGVGMGLASLRMSDAAGRAMPPSRSPSWVYPGVTVFSWDQVRCMANWLGLEVQMVPGARKVMLQASPDVCHDWILIRRRA